ncbi:zinc finger and BTB domain-containing protein 24-like [Dreissena polymorpha]|uniref:C2H2-type domain-containing protein n=1 Tax=Dreissena polymorpha TaxID=45954 RepID=A0A9D4NI68_DREPO|nr:zinc finger and BTB domain-containing protein 24-like [Dreissena polymorpha]KAH3897033.1 hypothetical protein DPMN_021217 [Dreissena polymorpha]
MEDTNTEGFGQFTLKTIVVPTFSAIENQPMVSEGTTGQSEGEGEAEMEAKDVYFICSHCTKCFDNKKSLMRHLDTHKDTVNEPKSEVINTKSRALDCKKCRLPFHSVEDLEFHMNMKHASDTESADYKHALRIVERAEGKLPCPVCNKVLASRGNLQKHMFLHSGVKPWSCDVCGKCFSLKGNRDKHALIHEGVRKFECQVCNKKFALKGNLHQHILTHTETKFFRCEYCSAEFTLKGNLDKHVRRHFDAKPKKSGKKGRDPQLLLMKNEEENAANQIREVEPMIEEVAEHVEIQNDSTLDNQGMYLDCNYASDNLNILGECATVVLSKSEPRFGNSNVSQLVSSVSEHINGIKPDPDHAEVSTEYESISSISKLDGTECVPEPDPSAAMATAGPNDALSGNSVPAGHVKVAVSLRNPSTGARNTVLLIMKKGQSIDQKRIAQMLDARMVCKQ